MSFHGNEGSGVTERPERSERPVTPLSPTSTVGSANPMHSEEPESPATSVSSVSTKISSHEKTQQSQVNKIGKLPEDLKLVLFFDGTGNSFSGSSADTNVVKLLKMLDRKESNQYHYYQTGIGTYGLNEESVSKSLLGEIRSTLNKSIDMAIGTTFDSHVLAGYRFLMRYYETGAKIYMFGFSRGAFTARFLARLIGTIGLLCKGNEEMIPFAYSLYQRYLTGRIRDLRDAQRNYEKAGTQEDGMERPFDKSVGSGIENEDVDDPDSPRLSDESQEALNEIQSFSDTFCRKGKHDEKIKVFFLGLWDCVGSVSLLDCKSPIPMPTKGTAHYVRHAVAVDERRVKFKAALFAQDYCSNNTVDSSTSDDTKDSGGLIGRIKGVFDSLLRHDHIELVKGAAPQFLQDAAGQLQSAAGQLQDAAGQLQDATPQILQDAAGQLQNAAPQLLQDAAGQLQDAAPQLLQDAAQQLQNVAHQVQDIAQHVAQQVQNAISQSLQKSELTDDSAPEIEEIKEVWFPGCHGDVGGGWPLEAEAKTQISDITLAWMIRELQMVDRADESAALNWSPRVRSWLREVEQSATKTAAESKIHDSLSFGCDTHFLTVLLWKFMEIIPLIRRFELDAKTGKWKVAHLPLNMGGTRCIPRNAVLHQSLIDRLNHESYNPSNHHGDKGTHCLKGKTGEQMTFREIENGGSGSHRTYHFDYGENERFCGGFMDYPVWLSWIYGAVIGGLVTSYSLVFFVMLYYYITRYTNLELIVLAEKGRGSLMRLAE